MGYAGQEADERVKENADKKADSAARRDEVAKKFGMYGSYILGEGQGYAAIPHAIDIYQAALGLSINEAWYIKILCRYLPNIYPSMSKIAKQTGVDAGKMSRIKSGLKAKGYIHDNGKHAKGKFNKDLNIMPFFDALFICIACDANSSLVIGNARDKIRAEFLSWIGSDNAEFYKERALSFELPLSLDIAKKFAAMRGLFLNWQYIESMQSGAALEKLENITADKMRELELKNAIDKAISGAFVLSWYPKIEYGWLREIAASSLVVDDIATMTGWYLKYDEMPTAKAYMAYVNKCVQNNKKMLTERGINNAYSYIEA